MSHQKITGQFTNVKLIKVPTSAGTFTDEIEAQPAKQQEPAKAQPARKEKKYLKQFGSGK